MRATELRHLLEHLQDTREIVLRSGGDGCARPSDELAEVWCAARNDANDAYAAWRQRPGPDAYARYVAAADRADAAQAALSASCGQARTFRLSEALD
ncbi:MAG TPA: hypothetical protein VHE14_07895 [Solirubrobacteraceae bacterium]|nr:hypothetical protein [Solirubrobacteraceae bacterium]